MEMIRFFVLEDQGVHYPNLEGGFDGCELLSRS